MSKKDFYCESWSSQVEAIVLRKPLLLSFRKTNQGFDVFCKSPQLVGSGTTKQAALEMLFDHLMIDYYEYSLNPGDQTEVDVSYGKKLKRFFNSEKVPEKLLDMKPDL